MKDARFAAMSLVFVLLLSATALLIVAPPARATTYPSSSYGFNGTVPQEGSGASVLLMDLNGDGVADLVVGAPHNGTASSGSVTFYLSAVVGGTLVPFAEPMTVFGWSDSLFGFSLADVGDMAGHGPTLAVGAPLASPNGLGSAGNITLFYGGAGFTGAPSAWINGTQASEELGYSLAAAGDVNGDTYADLLAGAPFCGPSSNGCADIFFGGSTIAQVPSLTYTTSSSGALFGFSLAGNGSVDSNGALDIAVGAPFQATSAGAAAGAVYIIRNLMGKGGSVNRTTTVAGGTAGGHFGFSVAMDDFNGDTFSDVAVGAPQAANGAGTVSILYGASKFTGAIGTTLTGAAGEAFGSALAAGNFRRDLYADLLVGAPDSTLNATGVGRAYGFYGGSGGLPGSPNVTLVPSAGDRAFGSSVTVGGDFNQDGGPDYAVGDPQYSSASDANLGRAVVYPGTIVVTPVNPILLGWVCVPNTWDAATQSCVGIGGFAVSLQSPTTTKTDTSLTNGSFSFTAVPGTYWVNTTLFPYIDNSTSLTVDVDHVYTILVFPLKRPQVYGYAKDAENRTAYAGVTVALYNATGALVNRTTTPGTSGGNYSIYIPTAFLPAVDASLDLTVKMWDATHYLNSTSISLARNATANESMFLNRFPVVSGAIRDYSTALPIAGATVQATQGTTVVATTTSGAAGAYILVGTNASVPGGLYLNITATGHERAQATLTVNQNASYTQNFFLQSDTIAPTSQISPLLPAYTDTAVFSIAATATDNYPNNVAGVALYYRFNNTGSYTLYATDTSAPYVFSFNSTEARGDGRYGFYTIATDYGGNRQATPSSNMTWTIVDTQRPNSTVVALPTFETVANFTLSATAADWNPISQVALYYRQGASGSYSLLSADTTGPYMWSFNTSLLGTGDGLYEFYSLATDAAGNVETVPASPDAQTTVDTSAPALAITSPTAGEVLGTGWVNVTWTAVDATSGVAKVDASLDGGAWVHAGTAGYYNFTLVPDGPHTVAVNATDLAGNSLTDSVSFTVSTVTPVVSISTPTAGAYVATSSIALTWSISNTGTGLESIQVRLDSDAWQTLAATATSYTFTSVPDGTHTVDVQALGLNGAQSSASVTVTVDTAPPSILITSPANNTWTASASVTASFSAADATSGILDTMLSVDGGTAVNVTGRTSDTITGLDDGSHTITLTATDRAGNTATASVTVKVDTTAPQVQITGPTAGVTLTSANVTVTWTATDSGSGVSLTQVSLDTGAYETVTGMSSTLHGLSNGNHTVSVRVTDVAGNVRTVSVTFSVSTTAPPPPPPPSQPLDPLVIAAIAAVVVAVIAGVAAGLYLRRKRTKPAKATESKAEEPPSQGGGA